MKSQLWQDTKIKRVSLRQDIERKIIAIDNWGVLFRAILTLSSFFYIMFKIPLSKQSSSQEQFTRTRWLKLHTQTAYKMTP